MWIPHELSVLTEGDDDNNDENDNDDYKEFEVCVSTQVRVYAQFRQMTRRDNSQIIYRV